MTSLSSLLPAASALRASAGTSIASGDVVKLLTPLSSLLDIGESASGQVLSSKAVAGQPFQVVLSLITNSGEQATVQATSKQPLPQGTQVTVTQLASGSAAVTVQQVKSNAVGTLTELDTQQLPVGTLVQGKVISSQLQPQAGTYRSLVTLLNTAMAGSTLEIDSPGPLRLGSLLSAQVQGAQSLNFVPLSGRLAQLAVNQQLQTQQSRQGSLEGVLAALQNLGDSSEVGDDLRASASRLLASLPDILQLTDTRGVAQALNASGLFLEAQLLTPQGGALPDDLKSSLLRLVAQILPNLPGNAPFNPADAAKVLANVLPGYVRSALGTLGQVGEKPPSGFPLPTRLLGSFDGENDLEHLLRLASAAVSRLQSHQLSSLEQSGLSEDGKVLTTWQLEIPMRNQQDIVPLQVRVQREDEPEDSKKQQAEQPAQQREPLWRVELAFDLDPLGPLQIQAQLLRGSLSGQLWAQWPATARLIDSQLDSLRERLLDSGLAVSDLQCHQGTPPQGPRTQLEQRWVDETA
ncbi:flagellar hook-length control protein FliK [Pseudomonas sp. M47T1]|uniref:flagellar hook-length control protein FliK n=2 Tax=unclassified Pseudomonas TaxID=196821 RepID=UPI003FD0BE44